MSASALSRDPESLLPAGSRRACPCRSLDWFVLLALCALGAAVLWLCLGAPWGGPAGRTEAPETRSAAVPAEETAAVQMLPRSYLTKNRQMDWEHASLPGVVFSTDFKYHEATKELEVKVGGLYFIYAQLAVHCTDSKCNKTKTINLNIYQRFPKTNDSVVLTVSLHLSSKSEDKMSKFSATLQPLKKDDILYVELSSEVDDEEWYLQQTTKRETFFGLFRLSSSSEPPAHQLKA